MLGLSRDLVALGRAVARVAATSSLLLMSTISLHAENCFYEGQSLIGPDCSYEISHGNPNNYKSCAQCAHDICEQYGAKDYPCINSCIAGTEQSPCAS